MLKNFSDKQLALFAILIIVCIGGGVPVLTKVAVTEMPPFSFTFFRFAIATLCILPFFLKNKPKLHKDFFKVIIFSLLLSFNVTIFPIGVALTTATIGGTLYVLSPLFIALLSYFLLAEKFHLNKIVGLIIGFIGALIIILLPILTQGAAFSGNIMGNLIIFIGAAATSLYTVLSKPFQKLYTPQQLTSLFIFTTCFVLFFLALTDIWTHPLWWQHVSNSSILSTFYVGLLGTVIWYLLYQYAIKHGSPVIASMTLYLQPVTTFLWATVLLGEQLNAGFLIGSAFAFLGVYLILKSK